MKWRHTNQDKGDPLKWSRPSDDGLNYTLEQWEWKRGRFISVMLIKENQLLFVTLHDLSSDLALSPTSCMTLNNLHSSQFKSLLDFKIKIILILILIPNSKKKDHQDQVRSAWSDFPWPLWPHLLPLSFRCTRSLRHAGLLVMPHTCQTPSQSHSGATVLAVAQSWAASPLDSHGLFLHLFQVFTLISAI